MRKPDNSRRARSARRAAGSLLAAALFWTAGSARAAPEIRWAKTYTPRVWTYAAGSQVTAAYDSYKDGTVYVIADGNSRQTIAMDRLSSHDRAWVLDQLKKPHGLINDVAFLQWRDQRPVFRVNASFFSHGNLTESPVVWVQYLLLDRQNRPVKRICDPVVLYPTAGKQNLELMGTKVVRQCPGHREQDITGVVRLGCRAVMLRLHANRKEWLVMDAFSKQDDIRLRTLGIPGDWWDPRYPVGQWPDPVIGEVIR